MIKSVVGVTEKEFQSWDKGELESTKGLIEFLKKDASNHPEWWESDVVLETELAQLSAASERIDKVLASK